MSIESLSFVRRMMGYGFPINFSVRARNDSQHFIHMLDQHYSNVTPINCLFSRKVDAQYFQIVPITYGTDDHVFQLAEIYVHTNQTHFIY